MSNFQPTFFSFVNNGFGSLTIDSIQVYSGNNTWEDLTDNVLPDGNGAQNAGIKSPSYKTLTFTDTLTLSILIDADLVNQVPYASDDASLLFSINGSNLHIDIQQDGKMKKTGIYGSNPGAISWDCFFMPVGETTEFVVSSN